MILKGFHAFHEGDSQPATLSQQELYSSGLISYPRTEAWHRMDEGGIK